MPELNNTILKNSANLKAYYRMESGALLADSAGAYTLTNGNTVGEGTGMFGGGADFGASWGHNKSLSVADNMGIAGNGTFSVSFWVKLASDIASGTGVLFRLCSTATADRYFRIIYEYNGGTRRIGVDLAGSIYYYNITLGTGWHHIVVRRNGTTGSDIFIDNAIRTSSVSFGVATVGANFIDFGGDRGTLGFAGVIDDLSVFNVLLSADQVKELYEGRMVGELWPQTGLVAIYHLNGNSANLYGNTATDTAVTYSLANGKFGQGAGFNGLSSMINTTRPFDLPADLTISYWFKAGSTNQYGGMIAVDGTSAGNWGYKIIQSDGGASGTTGNLIALNFPAVTAVNTGLVVANTTSWNYFVLVRTGGVWYPYLNGKLGTTSSATPQTPNGNFVIGAANNGANYWNGAIDEVACFTVAKDAAWVRKQYAWGRGLLT